MKNRNTIDILLIAFFAIGIIIGIFTTIRFVDVNIEDVNLNFASLNIRNVFVTTFLVNLLWIAVVMLLGAKETTSPLLFAVLLVKGYFSGFSFSYLIKCCGISYTIKAVFGLFIPSLIIGISIILLCKYLICKNFKNTQGSILFALSVYVFANIVQSYMQYIVFYKF